jgi:hypothetical protein
MLKRLLAVTLSMRQAEHPLTDWHSASSWAPVIDRFHDMKRP